MARVFQFACVLVLVGSMAMFISELFRNESTSLVDFRAFHETEKDIYPTFSMCMTGPGIWNSTKLKEKYGIKDVKKYINFLKGDIWDDNMHQIDYDDVTVGLNDLVQSWSLWVDSVLKAPTYVWSNESNITSASDLEKQNDTLFIEMAHFSISLRNPDAKCFSLDLSRKKISGIDSKVIGRIEVSMKHQFLMNFDCLYYLHYPGQLIAGHFLLDVDSNKPNALPLMRVYAINMIEVIRRRDTYREPCHKESEKHDKYVLRHLLKSAKCKPRYLKLDNDFEYPGICNNSYAMKKAHLKPEYFDGPLFRKRFAKPCDQLKTVSKDTKEYPFVENEVWYSPSIFILRLQFISDSYKEIRHIKDYGLKSFGADVSAIIGFVCGVSIWKMPDALKIIVIWMKQKKWVK